jgi:hypothetical protein
VGTEVTTTVRPAGRVLILAASWGTISTSGLIRSLPCIADINFGVSAGNAGFVTAIGLFDAATGGNLIGIGTISVTIAAGDPVFVAANRFSIQVS